MIYVIYKFFHVQLVASGMSKKGEDLNTLNYEKLKKSITYFRCYFSNLVIVSELKCEMLGLEPVISINVHN